MTDRTFSRLVLLVCLLALPLLVATGWSSVPVVAPIAWLIEYDGDVRVQRHDAPDALPVQNAGIELRSGDTVTTGPNAFARILMRNGVEMYAGANDSHTIQLDSAPASVGGLSALVAWIFDREPEDAPGWSRSGAEPEPAVLITPRDGYVLTEQPVARWMQAVPTASGYRLQLLRDTSPGACEAGSTPIWTTATTDTTATLPMLSDLAAGTSYRLELLDTGGTVQDYGCFEVPTEAQRRRIENLRTSIEDAYGAIEKNAVAAVLYAGLLAREEHFADALNVLDGVSGDRATRPAARRIRNYVYAEVGPPLMIEEERLGASR